MYVHTPSRRGKIILKRSSPPNMYVLTIILSHILLLPLNLQYKYGKDKLRSNSGPFYFFSEPVLFRSPTKKGSVSHPSRSRSKSPPSLHFEPPVKSLPIFWRGMSAAGCLPGAKAQEFQRFGKSCGDSAPPRRQQGWRPTARCLQGSRGEVRLLLGVKKEVVEEARWAATSRGRFPTAGKQSQGKQRPEGHSRWRTT